MSAPRGSVRSSLDEELTDAVAGWARTQRVGGNQRVGEGPAGGWGPAGGGDTAGGAGPRRGGRTRRGGGTQRVGGNQKEASRMDDRDKMLDVTLTQIEKQFGKGAVMKLGEHPMGAGISVIPTGSLALDIALGVGGIPRGRVVEVFGPEGAGKTTVCPHVIAEAQRHGGIAAFIDAEHALDPTYAQRLGVNIDELLVSPPDSREHALSMADMLVRSGALDVVVIGSGAARGDRVRDGRHARRAPGPADVAGHAQARGVAVAVRDHGHLHQPAAREDR